MITIKDFPDYAVTINGEIWSKPRKDMSGRKRTGKWLKPHKCNEGGHLIIGLRKDGKTKFCLVHRLVLTTFIGECPNGMECRHLNNNPADNRLENLCWDTPKNNQADRIKNGTDTKGEKHGLSKVNELQVRVIRRLREQKYGTYQEIANLFDISTSWAWNIINRTCWKHLKGI